MHRSGLDGMARACLVKTGYCVSHSIPAPSVRHQPSKRTCSRGAWKNIYEAN